MPYKDIAKRRSMNVVTAAKIRAKKRGMVLAAKDRPCSDCGIQYPYYVMEFDHVRGEKKFEIAYAVRYAIEDVAVELLKCDVVCSNCHKIREHSRGYDHREDVQTLDGDSPLSREIIN